MPQSSKEGLVLVAQSVLDRSLMDLGKSSHPCGVCSVCPASLFDIFMWWFDPPFRNLEKRLWVTLFYMVIRLAQNATVFNHSDQHVHDVIHLVYLCFALWASLFCYWQLPSVWHYHLT
ncbi:hypothetical protein CsSME_00030785 [Camellia sinensis var. sinensis]